MTVALLLLFKGYLKQVLIVFLTDLKLTVYPRLALNFWFPPALPPKYWDYTLLPPRPLPRRIEFKTVCMLEKWVLYYGPKLLASLTLVCQTLSFSSGWSHAVSAVVLGWQVSPLFFVMLRIKHRDICKQARLPPELHPPPSDRLLFFFFLKFFKDSFLILDLTFCFEVGEGISWAFTTYFDIYLQL